jgi:hypothetical protein
MPAGVLAFVVSCVENWLRGSMKACCPMILWRISKHSTLDGRGGLFASALGTAVDLLGVKPDEVMIGRGAFR